MKRIPLVETKPHPIKWLLRSFNCYLRISVHLKC